nr:hypothetical protein [Tanacetum cinerariifolium]
MMKRIGELEHIMSNLIQENKGLEERLDSHGARLYTLEQLDIPHRVSKAVSEVVTEAVDWAIDKPSEADNDKANAKTEVESMVIVTMQQDMSSLSLMTSPIIDLTSRPESPKATMMKRIGELEHIMSNLIQENKGLEERDLPEADMKEILHQRMWETESYKSHEDHMQLYEALEKSMNRDHSQELAQDLAEARKKKKKSRELPKMPPGSAHILKVNLRQDWWKPLEEERPATSEPAWSIPSSDAPVPTNIWASALTSNYSPPAEDSLLAQTGDIAAFMDWFCKRRGITELKPQDLEGLAFEIVKVFHPDVIHLQYQMEKCHKLLTDSVDDPILRHNVSKSSEPRASL